VRRLREAGYVVAGIDPNFYPAKIPWNYQPDLQVASVDQLPRAFWDARAVVHLAAISNDPMSELDERLTYDTNVRLVAEVSEVFDSARHVLASSASVYGFSQENCVESSPVNPLSTYAASKISAERILNLLNPASISLRFGTLWGASPNFRVDLAVNHFALEGIVDGKITPLSNSRRPILHVEDAARAIVSAVQSSPEQYHGIYNITGQNVEIYTAAAKVGLFMNKEVITEDSKRDADARSYHAATMRDPHLVPRETISLDDEVAMNNLVKCAEENAIDALPRIAALKKLLARGMQTL
jgi:nucleoside-diphosphate-sugar epimerase